MNEKLLWAEVFETNKKAETRWYWDLADYIMKYTVWCKKKRGHWESTGCDIFQWKAVEYLMFGSCLHYEYSK